MELLCGLGLIHWFVHVPMEQCAQRTFEQMILFLSNLLPFPPHVEFCTQWVIVSIDLRLHRNVWDLLVLSCCILPTTLPRMDGGYKVMQDECFEHPLMACSPQSLTFDWHRRVRKCNIISSTQFMIRFIIQFVTSLGLWMHITLCQTSDLGVPCEWGSVSRQWKIGQSFGCRTAVAGAWLWSRRRRGWMRPGRHAECMEETVFNFISNVSQFK